MRDVFEDQESTLKDAIGRLEKLGLSYMLTGSTAMVHYALMRMTNDIDIVIDVEPRDASRIISAFQSDYYVPEERAYDSIVRRSMFNVINQKTFVKVDLVIRKNERFHRHVFDRRIRISFSGIDLWIIQKEDLILSKMNWARDSRSELQMRDVAGMMITGYDNVYVNDWAKRIGITDILDECIKLAGGSDA